MAFRSLLLSTALLTLAGPSLASQCGDLITAMDQQYRLGIIVGEQLASRDVTSDSGGANALTVVPNTGGVHGAEPPQLSKAQREALRQTLSAAKQADEAGDGTSCAAKVAEARRVVGPASR